MKWLRKSIAALFTALMMTVFLVVLLCFKETSFFCKRDFVHPQATMLLRGMAGLLLLCAGMMTVRGIGLPNSRLLRLALRFLPWGGLLCLQLVLCFYTYFLTGWDVKGILECAYAFAGGYADIHIWYLSMYHNNVPLVMFFSLIIRVLRMFMGNIGMDRCAYVLIAVQCVLNTLTGFLSHWIALRMTGSRRFALCTALVYSVFIGISPWLMIPYSDSMSLLFPTAIAATYLTRPHGKWEWLKWVAIGVLSGLGYMIKPQVLIATIAVVMVEVIRLIDTKVVLRGMRRLLCSLVILAVIVGPVKGAVIKSTPVELRPHQRMNLLHYVMMGLNTKTNGSYDWDDVVRSSSAQSMEERKAVQIAEIKKRLTEMSAGDMLDHLKKKTLTNYADGTFAWSCEGEFYSQWIADKDDVISPFLKSIIYTQGERYHYLLTFMHSIWLALLLGAIGKSIFCLLNRNAQSDGYSMMMLSVIGITLFQLIFECRARYLYLYGPFYVMLGMSGIWQALQFVLKRFYVHVMD